MPDESVASPEVEDFLDRSGFLQALHRHVDALAEIPLSHLPAPRVLAVDAAWGFGKSWVANRFRSQLKQAPDRHVAYIDAFRYDHHDDVFAVIASAILVALNPDKKKKVAFVKAAGGVLRQFAPVLVKATINLGAKTVGLDGSDLKEALSTVKDAVAEGGAKLTNRAVDRLLASYAKNQEIQEDFQTSLDAMTNELDKPLVIIIDELDRCRPSFALQFLERVKHLFSAEKVVFVMFWNSASIHESIRHTYGRETAAEPYLAKFVALTVPLTLPGPPKRNSESSIGRFIDKEMARVARSQGDPDFAFILAMLAQALNASLRDVQRAIALFRAVRGKVDNWPVDELAYLILQSVMNRGLAERVVAGEQSALATAVAQLPPPDLNAPAGPLVHLWAALTYRKDPDKFDEDAAHGGLPDSEYDAIVIGEMTRYESQGSPPTRWLDDANAAIKSALLEG